MSRSIMEWILPRIMLRKLALLPSSVTLIAASSGRVTVGISQPKAIVSETVFSLVPDDQKDVKEERSVRYYECF